MKSIPAARVRALPRPVPLRDAPSRTPRIVFWGRIWIVLIVAATAGGLLGGLQRALALLAALAFLGAVAGLRWRPLGLLSVGLLCTIDPMVRHLLLSGGWLRFNSLNYLLLLPIVLNINMLLRWRNSQLRLLVVLIAVLAVGLLYTSNRGLGYQHLLNLVSLLGILVYVRRAGTAPETMYWLGLVCGLAAALFGLLSFVRGTEWVNPNALVYLPLTGLFAGSLAAAAGRLRHRRALTLVLLAVVNTMWVMLTGARGGLIVALVCCAYLLSTLRTGGVRVTLVVAVLLAVVVTRLWFSEEASYSLEKIEILLDSSKTASKRTDGHLDLAIGGWYVFLDHPLGVGTGGFGATWANLGSRANVPMFRYGHEMQAHSAWVKTLAENGVVGIVLLGAFVASFAWIGWKRGRAAFRLGAFVTFAMGAAFLSSEFAAKGLWLLAAGAMLLLSPDPAGEGSRRPPADAVGSPPRPKEREAPRRPIGLIET